MGAAAAQSSSMVTQTEAAPAGASATCAVARAAAAPDAAGSAPRAHGGRIDDGSRPNTERRAAAPSSPSSWPRRGESSRAPSGLARALVPSSTLPA